MNNNIIVLIAFFGIVLFSCNEEKIKEKIDTNGCVEITVKTESLGEKTLYTYTENIYCNNKLHKTFVRKDTLPNLGDTLQNFENKESNWTQKVQKQYKFFVTVK